MLAELVNTSLTSLLLQMQELHRVLGSPEILTLHYGWRPCSASTLSNADQPTGMHNLDKLQR